MGNAGAGGLARAAAARATARARGIAAVDLDDIEIGDAGRQPVGNAEVAAPQGEAAIELRRIQRAAGPDIGIDRGCGFVAVGDQEIGQPSLEVEARRGAGEIEIARAVQRARSAVAGGETGELQAALIAGQLDGEAAQLRPVVLVEIAGIGDRDLAADVGPGGRAADRQRHAIIPGDAVLPHGQDLRQLLELAVAGHIEHRACPTAAPRQPRAAPTAAAAPCRSPR